MIFCRNKEKHGALPFLPPIHPTPGCEFSEIIEREVCKILLDLSGKSQNWKIKTKWRWAEGISGRRKVEEGMERKIYGKSLRYANSPISLQRIRIRAGDDFGMTSRKKNKKLEPLFTATVRRQRKFECRRSTIWTITWASYQETQ